METGFRLRQKQSRHHHRRVLNLCVDNSDQRKSASSAARFLCSDHGDLVAITLRRGPRKARFRLSEERVSEIPCYLRDLSLLPTAIEISAQSELALRAAK